MPVVTMTTFQVGESGVASRSRLMTPTRSSFVPSSACAMGRTARVLPVPVPATMPNPRRTPRGECPAALAAPVDSLPGSSPRKRSASASSSAPRDFQSTVSRSRPNASSMVSHAARVGAMTITRRAVPEATNASWSGGRYGSRTGRRAPGSVRAAESPAACPAPWWERAGLERAPEFPSSRLWSFAGLSWARHHGPVRSSAMVPPAQKSEPPRHFHA